MALAEKISTEFESPYLESPVPMSQGDFDLVTSVRAKLAKLVTHPGALEVAARRGCVRLRGPILQNEADRAILEISRIPGVTKIDRELDVVMNAEHFRIGEWKENTFLYEPEVYQGSVATPIRVGIAVTGLGLVGLGIKNRGFTRYALSLLGLGALVRATRNLSLSHLVGAITVPVMRLRRNLTLRAPIDQVYAFWKDFSNYPKFMSYIRDVHVNDQGGIEWTAVGPGGVPVRWDASVGALTENQRITWRSGTRSLLMNEGRISMSGDSEQTQLTVELTYAPPAGILGHAVIRILGFDPRQRIDLDLEVMRKLIEGESERVFGSQSFVD